MLSIVWHYNNNFYLNPTLYAYKFPIYKSKLSKLVAYAPMLGVIKKLLEAGQLVEIGSESPSLFDPRMCPTC